MLRNFMRNSLLVVGWVVGGLLFTTFYPLWFGLFLLASMASDNPVLFLGRVLSLEGEVVDKDDAFATVFFGGMFLVPWGLFFSVMWSR
jgi:hypothetical protein